MKCHQLLFLVLFSICGCQSKNEIRPQRKDIVDAVFGSGHIENQNQYTVMANAEGFVRAAYVTEGDTVHNGLPLFGLSNEVQQTQVVNALINLRYAETNLAQEAPPIQQLKIQIAQAQKKLQVDSINYWRYARLIKTQAVSAVDYDNSRLTYQNSETSLRVLQKNLADLQRNLNLSLANARAQYQIQKENNKYYRITSTGPGVIMNISKKVGDYVRKGDAIALVGVGTPIIKLDIAEEDIGRIKAGQRVLISLNSNKDKVYEAVISKIYPSFNANEQSFIVEALFKSLPRQVLNGTQLQANIIVETRKNALVIPSYYLVNDNYVMLAVNRKKRLVNTGIRTLEWTEITGGITEKDELTLPKQP